MPDGSHVAFVAISSSGVVNAVGALMTVRGIVVVMAEDPGYLSRRGKVVSLHEGGPVVGFVHRPGPVGPTVAQPRDGVDGDSHRPGSMGHRAHKEMGVVR